MLVVHVRFWPRLNCAWENKSFSVEDSKWNQNHRSVSGSQHFSLVLTFKARLKEALVSSESGLLHPPLMTGPVITDLCKHAKSEFKKKIFFFFREEKVNFGL